MDSSRKSTSCASHSQLDSSPPSIESSSKLRRSLSDERSVAGSTLSDSSFSCEKMASGRTSVSWNSLNGEQLAKGNRLQPHSHSKGSFGWLGYGTSLSSSK